MQTTLSSTACKFQKCLLKSNQITLIYFIIKTIFGIPLISALGLVESQLFKQKLLRSNLQTNINNIISHYQSILIGVLACIIVIFIAAFYNIIKSKSQKIIKYSFVICLFWQALTPITIAFIVLLFTSSDNLIYFILPIILFAFVQISSFTLQRIWISYSFITKNNFAHKPNLNLYLLNLIERLSFLATFLVQQQNQSSSIINKIFYIVLVAIYCLKLSTYTLILVSYFASKHYINETTQTFQTMSCVVCLIQCVIIIIYQITLQPTISVNFTFFSVVVSILACISVYSYTTYKQLFCLQRKNKYLFNTIDQIIQNRQIVNYLQSVYQLTGKDLSVDNSLILSGLKKNHAFTCKKTQCYCSQVSKLEEQNYNIQLSNPIFLKGFFQETLSDFQKEIKDNQSLYLKLLYFKFEIFQNYITIRRQMNQIVIKDSQDLDLKIGKTILQNIINDFIQQDNKKNGNLNIQSPLILNKTLNHMQAIIFTDINLKNQKWKFLKKGMCKTQDIQIGVVKEIQNLRNFQNIYTTYIKLFQKSVAFNSLCMFYFGQIVFFPKQLQKLNFNLKNLQIPLKQTQININNDMAKVMLDSRFCLLEFQISKYQNLNNVDVLKIFNFNDNVIKVFKYQKKDLIDEKIKILFPRMLWQHQQLLLKKFLNQQDKNLYQQAIDKYYVDKEGFVFSGLTSFKIVPKAKGISLIVLIFQKSVKDIILLDTNGYIQNIGATYFKNFGNIYEGIPLQTLFYIYSNQPNIEYLLKQNHKKIKMQLINGMSLGQKWKIFLLAVQNFIKVTAADNTKLIQMKQSPDNQSLHYQKFKRKLDQYISAQAKTLIDSNVQEQQNEKGQFIFKFSVIQVDVECKQNIIDSFVYYSVRFYNLKKNKIQIQSKQLLLDQINSKKNSIIWSSNNGNHSFQKVQSQSQTSENDDIQTSGVKAKKVKPKIQVEMVRSNMQSSTGKAPSVSYFYQKFIETCFDLFKNPDAISDHRLNMFTISSFICSSMLSCLAILCYFLFNLGLYEVKDIFFADGAVSDNMQLTQFMYNRAMNLKQFQDNSTQLAIIMQSADYERQILYNLITYDLGHYISDTTSMTSTKFYAFITVPVNWSFRQPDPKTKKIQTNQLLQYYYYLSQTIRANIQNNTVESNKTVQNALDLMRINFPQLKRINHGFLSLYQQLSNNSMNLLMWLVWIFGISHIIISLGIFIIFLKQKYFRRLQQIQTLSIYQIIPHKIIQIMSIHFNRYSNLIKSQHDLHRYQSHYQMNVLILPHDLQTYAQSMKNTIIPHKPNIPKQVFQMFAVILMLNLVFLLLLNDIFALFSPINKMMINVNNLMDSQNYLMEAYFDLKAQFIIDQKFNVSQSFFDQLLQSQNTTDVIFNRIAIDSLDLFSLYDSTYKTDFIALLINNNCELDKQLVTTQLYQKCVSYFKLKVMNNGVLTAMNFMTRKIKNIIYQIKDIIMLGNSSNTQQIAIKRFKALDLRQIDQSLIFMFKMYQETQARIFTSLGTVIIAVMQSTLIKVVIQVVILSVIYTIILYFNFKSEKLSLSKLYLSFVLIPTPISKMIKTFTVKIEQILQYNKQN